MKLVVTIVLANIAIALAGRPMPVDLQERWGFLMKEDPPLINRIVGGTAVANGERPYQVLLRRNGAFTCGGSFIGTQTVLTAAHCVDGNEGNPSLFSITYNTLTQSGGSSLAVSKIIKHSLYSSSTIDFDYAIIQLASAFTPGTNAATIALADDGQDPASNDVVIVSGWGRTTGGGSVSQTLLKASLNVVDRTTCGSRWGRTISARMVCAHSTSRSACNGDSGGPLTSGSTLVGVVSWGSSSCLHASLPNVYARVGDKDVNPWIKENLIG